MRPCSPSGCPGRAPSGRLIGCTRRRSARIPTRDCAAPPQFAWAPPADPGRTRRTAETPWSAFLGRRPPMQSPRRGVAERRRSRGIGLVTRRPHGPPGSRPRSTPSRTAVRRRRLAPPVGARAPQGRPQMIVPAVRFIFPPNGGHTPRTSREVGSGKPGACVVLERLSSPFASPKQFGRRPART